MDSKIFKIFAALGVPGLALGVFYGLFLKFDWKFSLVPEDYVGPIIILFMILVSSITLYALNLWSPKGDKTQPNDESSKVSSVLESSTKRLKDYFLIGCGIGNRLSILPVPKVEQDNRDFHEFVSYLKMLGISNKDVELINSFERKLAQSVANGDVKPIFNQYMESMNKLPDIIRKQCSEEQYRMLSFGKLLYDIPTLMHLNASTEDLYPVTLSLESLLPELNLSNALKSEIVKYIGMIKKNEESGAILDCANNISKTIYTVI